MTSNNQELFLQYNRRKADFLDSLQPCDFRNAASFNQAHIIIDELKKASDKVAADGGDLQEFILKAAQRLFREDSLAIEKLIAVVLGDNNFIKKC